MITAMRHLAASAALLLRRPRVRWPVARGTCDVVPSICGFPAITDGPLHAAPLVWCLRVAGFRKRPMARDTRHLLLCRGLRVSGGARSRSAEVRSATP